MSRLQRIRRRVALVIWKLINPPTRALAGVAPWWVVLETRGRRTGRPRQVPLARGPVDGKTTWVLAVHGEHADFVRNIAVDPEVRIRLKGRWRRGRASLEPPDAAVAHRFNAYARAGPRLVGIDPRVVRLELE
jgi:deazaflavin-dependent oxidoreductase (nitroreductase family)